MDPLQVFVRDLRARIVKEISERAALLVDGKAKDHADYMAKVEAIRTLKLVGDKFCVDVLQEMTREPMRQPPHRRST